MSPVRQKLLELFDDRAVLRGQFTLASGARSNYYIDARPLVLQSDVARVLGDAIRESLADIFEPIHGIGGLETAAIPIAMAAIMSYERFSVPMSAFFVRKSGKEHGTGRMIEGALPPDANVVIVDDVATSGLSMLAAATTMERAGYKVRRVLCICDRLQGAAERLSMYEFRSLFTITDLGIVPDVTS